MMPPGTRYLICARAWFLSPQLAARQRGDPAVALVGEADEVDHLGW
jgi:hypothetical protein